MSALLALPAAASDERPLSAGALQACAAQVQQLRADAPALNRQIAAFDARRAALNERSAALRREADTQDRDDLRAQLDLQQRRRAHNATLVAFNDEVAAQRQAIVVLDRLKQDYARDCAARSYRHEDFAALPPPAQAAMRAGLDDIVVPSLATEP
ncbi:hypothetical protein [Solimonas variicoloris]|uniref:hypothetical protein n=1 Tax=Solimonas variicoloris TaxID=254408 RepID=UPI0003A4A1AD|nr:hypothetical protein [Solimonas variicoloris]